MIDVLHGPSPAIEPATLCSPLPAARSWLAFGLREVAGDLAGRPDRDELTPDEEDRLSEMLDASVDAVLPRVTRLLDAELAARMESMPLHARLTLASSRQRRDLGVD